MIYYLLQVYNVLTSEYIDDSWNLLTLNEDGKFQLFIVIIIIIFLFCSCFF